MYELALFAGAGGGILGGKLLGWRTVCAVELDAAAREKLLARQNDGCLEPFPVWSDIRSFSARNGMVRPAIRALRRVRNRLVVSGGFPCQGVSCAGDGRGLEDERSGLWREQRRVIGEIRPRFVFIENSPALTTRGGVRVIGDLAGLGYDCRWGIVSAADAIWLGGTPCLDHLRERIWIAGTRSDSDGGGFEVERLAEPRELEGARRSEPHGFCEIRKLNNTAARADVDGFGGPAGVSGPLNGQEGDAREPLDYHSEGGPHWWAAEPGVGRMAHGVAGRVDRLACTGNGQVPAVVRLAWEILMGAETKSKF